MTPAAAIKLLQQAHTDSVCAVAGIAAPEVDAKWALLTHPVVLNNMLEVAAAAEATFGSRSRRERLRLDAALQALAKNVRNRS